jgi:lipoprotein
MKHYFILSVVAIAATLFSCKQEIVQTQLRDEQTYSKLVPSVREVLQQTSRGTIAIGGPRNIFDYVGIQHNTRLEEILQQYPHGINSKNFTTTTYAEYFKNEEKIPTELLTILQKEITPENYNLGFPTIVDSIKDEHLRICISRILKETKEGNFANIEELSFYLTTIENNIQQSSLFLMEDKEIILSMLSIYRHSAQYWNKKLGEYDFDLFGKSWKQWLIVAGCDAVGGLIGGLIGSSCPGVGTVVGAIRGSFLGSAAALSAIEIAEYNEFEPVF